MKARQTNTRRTEHAVVWVLREGYAFVRLDSGADCHVRRRLLGDALPGDEVEIAVDDRDPRGLSGRVVRILLEGAHRYLGRLEIDERGMGWVEPEGGFAFTLPAARSTLSRAASGDKVRFSVRIGAEGTYRAVIEESFGSADCARVCTDAVLSAQEIPTVFDAAVLDEAETLCTAPIDIQREGREDLRDLLVMTIDGPDAKDLDDAVSLSREGDGWLLGVHIADVSWYVRPGSLLDAEALRRGTSVYFADRVVPMLPKALSNGACSLHPGEDKRTLSALLHLDEQGNCLSARVTRSVIRTAVRGVYGEVNALLDGTADDGVCRKYAPVRRLVQELDTVAALLRKRAESRGVLAIDSIELHIELDQNGRAVGLSPRRTGVAEDIIEQCMVAANSAVAALAKAKKLPFVYRAHEQPDAERLEALVNTARAVGLPLPSGLAKLRPRALLKLLRQKAADTPYAPLIAEMSLRAQAKARYDIHPIGHYGLALDDYCHFTSPIRRYPDLFVHRALTDPAAVQRSAHTAALQSTRCEIRAAAAERTCTACYVAEYMRRFTGDVFEGVVVSVTEFGAFVRLENGAEGLIRAESFGMMLRYDGVSALVDRRGRAVCYVGRQCAVRLTAADVSSGKLTFAPVE